MTVHEATAGLAHISGFSGLGTNQCGPQLHQSEHAQTAIAGQRAADLDAMWIQLTEADGNADPEELARIAWSLFAQLGQLQAEETRLRAAVTDLAHRARRHPR